MKRIIALWLLCIGFFGRATAQANYGKPDLKKLAWLTGRWQEKTGKPGRSGTETWWPLSDSVLKGKGVHLKGRDTIFTENLSIIAKDDGLYYAADLAENEAVVLFKITLLTDEEFICRNPTHDFPKQIAYKRAGKGLTAVVSGNGKSIVYTFIKK
jgi:hypothetical protein